MLIKSGSAKSTFVGDWWLQSSSIRKSKVIIDCYVISFHSLFLEGIWTFIPKIYCCLQSASEWCQFYQRQKKRKLLVLQKLRSAPHTIREHIFAVQLEGKNLFWSWLCLVFFILIMFGVFWGELTFFRLLYYFFALLCNVLCFYGRTTKPSDPGSAPSEGKTLDAWVETMCTSANILSLMNTKKRKKKTQKHHKTQRKKTLKR